MKVNVTSRIASSHRQNFINIGCLVLLYFVAATDFAIADWNSGATIEDMSTRIAINVVDDGVHVTIDLAKNAINQLQKNTSHPISIDSFAHSAITIQANQALSPSIKKSIGVADKKNLSSSITTLIFPFLTGNKPKQIEISPDFGLIKKAGKNYIITVSHHGLPVIDHGILTNTEKLSLDWQDPWYSHFLNPKLKRDHKDPVMAFLYLEPRKIKSEIVVRIKEMASWADLELRDEVMIYPDEFASIKQKVSQFLVAQNKISADGKTLPPTLERVDYIRMGAADIQAYDPQQAQRQVATLIGVSITHQIKTLPAKVNWQWSLFNNKIQRVSIRAYDPAGLFDSYVTLDYPNFEWENMLADIDLTAISDKELSTSLVSVEKTDNASQYYWFTGIVGFLFLSFFCCRYIPYRLRLFVKLTAIFIALAISYSLFKNGKLNLAMNEATLDEIKARPILKQLLWNVYQAFEATQEEVAYDQLADSVSGDLRETLYLQNRQSFLAQDGAWSKVKSIDIKKLTDNSSSLEEGYLFDCEWLVIGEVIHWGHQHRRENIYRANIKIMPQNDNWKIFQLESIGQQRVDEISG